MAYSEENLQALISNPSFSKDISQWSGAQVSSFLSAIGATSWKQRLSDGSIVARNPLTGQTFTYKSPVGERPTQPVTQDANTLEILRSLVTAAVQNPASLGGTASASSTPQVAATATNPQALITSGTSPPTSQFGSTSMATTFGGVSTGRSSGNIAADYLNTLYQARPAFAQQQIDLLSQLGPAARDAVLAASPELAAASSHFQSTLSDPYGGALETYQDAMRAAQAARGFAGGGTGVAGEEARYLTNFAMQRRDAAAGSLAQIGGTLLGASGLAQSPDISLGNIGQIGLGMAQLAQQQLQYTQQRADSQQANAYAQQIYEQEMDALRRQQSLQAYNDMMANYRPSNAGTSRLTGGITY